MMYEYGTIELSGVDNSQSRASWTTLLTAPELSDGTDITTFNFTKGNDDWDPLPGLIADDMTGVSSTIPVSSVNVHAYGNQVFVSNITSNTQINMYNLNGVLMKSFKTNSDMNFRFTKGFWIVTVYAADGRKAVKVFLQ